MTDKKRPGSMSDNDRALVGAEQRRLASVLPAPPARFDGVTPVTYDDNHTPPPQDPPKPESIYGYENLSEPARAQIDALHSKVQELTDATARTWDARNVPERIDQIDNKLGALGTQLTRNDTVLREMVLPQINACTKAVNELNVQLPRMADALESCERITSDLMDRANARDVERAGRVEKYTATLAAIERRLVEREEAHEAVLAEHAAQAARLVVLEDDKTKRDATEKALSTQDKRRGGTAGGFVGAIVAAIISILTALGHK